MSPLDISSMLSKPNCMKLDHTRGLRQPGATQNFKEDKRSGTSVQSCECAIFLVKTLLTLWTSPLNPTKSMPRVPTGKYELLTAEPVVVR